MWQGSISTLDRVHLNSLEDDAAVIHDSCDAAERAREPIERHGAAIHAARVVVEEDVAIRVVADNGLVDGADAAATGRIATDERRSPAPRGEVIGRLGSFVLKAPLARQARQAPGAPGAREGARDGPKNRKKGRDG